METQQPPSWRFGLDVFGGGFPYRCKKKGFKPKPPIPTSTRFLMQLAMQSSRTGRKTKKWKLRQVAGFPRNLPLLCNSWREDLVTPGPPLFRKENMCSRGSLAHTGSENAHLPANRGSPKVGDISSFACRSKGKPSYTDPIESLTMALKPSLWLCHCPQMIP